MVFGVGVADGGLLVPDHFGGGGLGLVHTGNDGSNNQTNDSYNSKNSKKFLHFLLLFASLRGIFRLLL